MSISDTNPHEALQRKLWGPLDRATGRFATTRSVMILVGVYCAWIAVTTRANYTIEEMRTRDLCVLALLATSIIGLGHIFIKPRAITMGVAGGMIMLNAFLRMLGFGIPVWQNEVSFDGWWGADLWHFFESSNAVPVWGLLGFLGGFLIWRRRHMSIVVDEGDRLVGQPNDPMGARDAP